MLDKMGDRLKAGEQAEAGRVLDQNKPIMVRLDGKAFHTYTKGLQRPYDKRLITCMQETTKFLIEKTHAQLGYTQSDEISLTFLPQEGKEIYYAANIQKLTSVLASIATAFFNDKARDILPEKMNSEKKEFAFFDCRAWNVPHLEEVVDVFVWRQEDAIKNSISMLAQAYFSPKDLHKINGPEKIKMLETKNISWDAQPSHFKMGSFWGRILKEELIPEEYKVHHKKSDATHYARSSVEEIMLPRLKTLADQKMVFDFLRDNQEIKKKYKM